MAETYRLIKRRDAENEPNAPRLIKSRGGNRVVAAEPEQTPEETRSLLSQAGGVGLSGLHTVGSLLSTVSRGTHGTINALTGGEGGFGNLNPIDSTGGIEGSRHLERMGILAKNDPTKWEWRDPLAGVADIAMDPLTYAAGVGLVKRGIQGIGALTGLNPVVKAGAAIAAKSAPVTKLKQLFHASSMGRTTHGTQKMAERTYDDISGNLVNADLGVNNIVRNMELLPGGPIAKDAERHAIEMGNPSREILPLKAMDDAAHAEKQALGIPTGDLENTVKQFTKVGAPRALRTDVLDDSGNVVRSIDNTVGGPVSPDAAPVNYLRPNQRTEYAPRHIAEGTEWGGVAGSGSRLAMSTKNSLDQHRNTELFGNASTDLINRVFVRAGEHLNTLPTGLSANQQARELSRFIKREFRGEDLRSGTNLTGNYSAGTAGFDPLTGMPIPRAHSRPRELGQFIVNNPQLTKSGPFTNHPVHDYHTSLKAAAQQIPKARNALKFMAENAAINHGEPLDVLRRNRLDNAPTVRDAAKALDLTTDKVGKHVLGQLPPGVLSQVNTAAGDEAARLAAHAVSQGDTRPVADIAKEMFPRIRDRQVLDLQLPSGEFQSLTGFMEPPPQDATGGFLSGLNTMWKANMLAWPATQIRNAGSAAVQAGLKGHAGLGDLYSGAQLVRGQQVSGLAKHPEVASLMASQGIDETEAVRRLVGAYVPASNSIASEIPIGQIGSELTDLAGNVPGRVPVAAHEAFTGPLGALAGYRDGKHVGWNAINPAAITNVLGHKETGYGPAMAANMVARNVEQPIRMGSVMGLMRQGHSTKSAAKQVGEAQGNYGAREFSEFEKKIKQYVPFYAFSTRMGKQVLSELANNPGGRLGTMLKTEDKLHGSDPSLPDSVSSSTAIPFPYGQPDDGTKRYLTGLGLMHEPAINTLGALAGGNFRGAGYDLLGMLNPLAKTPLEHITGQSFYQRGEPQEHLDPNVGRILSNVGVMAGLRDKDAGPVQYPGSAALETALAVSPFSRMVTTAKQLTDTRKGIGAKAINTLTGARLTDVSPDKQRYTIQRRAKKMALATGARSHEDVYFSKEELAKLKETDPSLHMKQVKLQAILKSLNRKQSAK